MDLNKKNLSIIINFYNRAKRIFRFLHIYLPLILFAFLFSLNINIYVNLGILLLSAYVTRVMWVFCTNKYNLYKKAKDILEMEITKTFK